MKKLLAILALVVFIGGIGTPAIASNSNNLTLISLSKDDPKKKEKKATKKSATKSEAKSESGCDKKEPCSKECGEKGKK